MVFENWQFETRRRGVAEPMTVARLIEALRQHDPASLVVCVDASGRRVWATDVDSYEVCDTYPGSNLDVFNSKRDPAESRVRVTEVV